MKHNKLFAFLLAIMLFVVTFAACDLAKPDPKPTDTYTVTFVYGGTDADKTSTVESGSTVTLPQTPEREGYTFGGWYKDAACSDGQKWDSSTKVTGNITLYAKWTENPKEENKYDVITIAQALAICGGLAEGGETIDRYYVKGTIDSIDNASYGQMTISDATGSIMVYGTYSADGAKRYPDLDDKPVKGDTVILYGLLKNYKGTLEISSGWIIEVEHAEKEVFDDGGKTELTVAEATSLCLKLADGEKSEKRYKITATIVSIDNANYGQMTISDETGTISVYGTYSADGATRYPELADKPYAGDIVVLSAQLQNFKDTAEISSGWILEFQHVEQEIDESQYTAMSVADARDAADGALVKLTGVVARITFASGKIPSGFYLVDNTNSIYVYDSQVAPRVAIGNTVTILGAKTHWILATEQTNAAKYGYKGCNQLEKVKLLENDEKTTGVFDKSWITESTVKDVMNTPVTTDITSTIFKVNALIKKSVGDGFINYYFDDLDGKTGSYAYTQCNGSDLDWLEKYDGKICTVYLSALNAKSTAAGCNWRFIPVEVIDENYVFDLDKAGEYAVIYHALDLFAPSYASDPELELVTTVSSELLGFENATLTYSSSDENVVYFTDGVMHTKDAGTAVITIKGKLDGHTEYTHEVTISVIDANSYNSVTVAEAIAAEVDDEVTVRGIVGPSLVNQVGFYLIDTTGVIAIKTNSEDMAKVSIGDEVIFKGTRTQFKSTSTLPGQTCLLDSTLELNLYGHNEYPLDAFITDKTFNEIYAYEATENHSGEAYIVEAKIYLGSGSNARYYVGSDEDHQIRCYSSSAAQYSWMQPYVGETVKLEIALINWNNKNYYTVCVLAIYLEDGTKVVNELNFK